MPELPEVETTVRGLRKYVVGRKVTRLWTDWPKISPRQPFAQIAQKISGRKITAVRRRAKYIVFDISGPASIVIHQKISGHLLYGKWKKKGKIWVSTGEGPIADDPKNAYIRLILWLDNDRQIALSDLRRFGTISLVEDRDTRSGNMLDELGPEPLGISLKDFRALFEKKKGYLKPVLMDPLFIAGIGNIYADEILWHAGLHPLARVEKLTPRDIAALHKHTFKILGTAVRRGGTSIDDYRDPDGRKGGFQNMTRAYHRTGSPCAKKDGGIITRIVIGQRSAHFCPKHQKKR